MSKNELRTARNSIALWMYVAGSLQQFCEDIQYRLDANNNLDPNFFVFFNTKYQQTLINMGYNRKLFKDNTTLLASLRRTYAQLERSRNLIDKTIAKNIRYAYENPAQNQAQYTDWTLLLTSHYTPAYPNEKILYSKLGKTNYAEIGYYIFISDKELNELFQDIKEIERIYEKCCDCIESLYTYYNNNNNCKYSDLYFTTTSNKPISLSILFAFDAGQTDFYYFYINYHNFRSFSAFMKEFNKLKNWINKNSKNKKIDKTGDAASPESPDFDEFILKWIRPACKMEHTQDFDVRKNEIGLRNSNYIKYE